jgi:hypothetical protein
MDRLQAAVSKSREHHVAFATDAGSFDAHIDACEGLGSNATGFALRGPIASGPYQGRSFIGTYDHTKAALTSQVLPDDQR